MIIMRTRFLNPAITDVTVKAPVTPNIFPIVHERDRFNNREQSETNRNDENAMCYYLSEYLRKCYMKNHFDHFWTFFVHFAIEAR